MRRLLPVIVALAAGATCATAHAGSYDVWSCRGPAGQPAATDAWQPYGSVAAATTRTDTCASGGSLTAALSGTADEGADGALTGFRYVQSQGVTPGDWRVEMAGGAFGDGSPIGVYESGLTAGPDPLASPVTAGCDNDASCSFGDPSDPLAAGNVFSGTLPPGGTLSLNAFCRSTSSLCAPSATPAAQVQLYRSRVRFTDAAPPAVGALGGSAAGGVPLTGRVALTADLSDGGGGVLRAELLLDGTVVATDSGRGRCTEPFTTPLPCPDAERAQFELDTAALSPGPHTLAVRGVDAGQETATSAPLPIIVAGPTGPPGALPAPPAPTPPATPGPVTGFRVLYDHTHLRPRGKRVAGIVAGAAGQRLGGVPLRFERRPLGAGDIAWRRAGTGRTDNAGHFTFPVVTSSGEWRVLPASAPAPGTTTVTFVDRLQVSAAASRGTLRNGQTLTVRGRILGDGGAWSGRSVLVQAIVRGRWRTVDDITVSSRARTTWRYRFTTTRTTARYRFRLLLPAAKGLPWKPTASAPVSVLVRP